LTQFAYFLIFLLVFFLGFLLGVLFGFFHKGKLNNICKKPFEKQSLFSSINEEYKNFLSYEGFEQ